VNAINVVGETGHIRIVGPDSESAAKDLPDRRLKLRLWAYAPGPKPIRSRVTTVRKMELHRALLLA